MLQGEDKLKGSAQANLERNRQKFERKNRPVPIWRRALANWRRALANWRRALANSRRALARKSSYFDKIAQLSVSEPQDAHESLEIEGFVAIGFLSNVCTFSLPSLLQLGLGANA